MKKRSDYWLADRPRETAACGHPKLTFGCMDCLAFINHVIFYRWFMSPHTPPPLCKSCHGRMAVIGNIDPYWKVIELCCSPGDGWDDGCSTDEITMDEIEAQDREPAGK